MLTTTLGVLLPCRLTAIELFSFTTSLKIDWNRTIFRILLACSLTEIENTGGSYQKYINNIVV